MKRKLGPEKFCEFAVLLLERKVEGVSPGDVKKEVKDKFAVDLDTFSDRGAVFIKY